MANSKQRLNIAEKVIYNIVNVDRNLNQKEKDMLSDIEKLIGYDDFLKLCVKIMSK
jgi:hypothetical protein